LRLEEEVFAIKELKRLDVHKNLNFIVNVNGRMEEITLYRGYIEKIPPSFSVFKMLKKLVLSGLFSLSFIPKFFKDFTKLEEFYLGGNSFEIFPEPILELTALRRLDLSTNNIIEVPTAISNLTSLEYLNLSHNHSLKTLPESLGNLSKLKHLDVSQCYGLDIPEVILNMESLIIRGNDDLKVDANGNIKIELGLRDQGSPTVNDFERDDIETSLVKAQDIVIKDEKIKIFFDYPIKNKVYFEFESKSKKGFTRLDLFRCIYDGYMRIYREETAEV
ncbi:unnamed protein product, partial [marine sediment metagenome]